MPLRVPTRLAAVLLLMSQHAAADEVPAQRQVLVLARAMAYDRNLAGRAGESVSVGVVHGNDDDSVALARDIHRGFASLQAVRVGGLPLEASLLVWSTPDALATTIREKGIDVLYVSSGLSGSVADILGITRNLKVLSVAARQEDLTAGLALGVFAVDSEPKVVVNLTASKAEGASFSADLLRLAEIVR